MLVYTYECPACKKTMRDLSIAAKRHEKCPSKDPGPYWVLKEIWIEGVDPPRDTAKSSSAR